MLPLAFRFFFFHHLAVRLSGLGMTMRIEVMVSSPWRNRGRRDVLRQHHLNCGNRVPGAQVSLRFFMGSIPDKMDEEMLEMIEEEKRFNSDIVEVGGPDTDPAAKKFDTYVLEDRPSALTYRTAAGSHWIVTNVPEFDFVFYLDDESYVHYPRLIVRLQDAKERNAQSTEFFVVGYLMQTKLDPDELTICETSLSPEQCKDPDTVEMIEESCKHMVPEVSATLCLIYQTRCEKDGVRDDDIPECIRKEYKRTKEVAKYFGTKYSPIWPLGMGFLCGSRVVRYIAHNRDYFKMRGSADVSIGYWLNSMEDIVWIDAAMDFFHDLEDPEFTSLFSRAVTDKTLLVHRMTAESWGKVDADTCDLDWST